MTELTPTEWTIADIAAGIRARRLSPVEVTRAYLARIRTHDGALRSYIAVDEDGALAAARVLEREALAGAWRGPLHGVPLAYKDLFVVRGLPTSCGTAIPDYWQSGHEASAVARLAAAGAITLGKLNMSELALGPFGDNVHHGDCRNPWRPDHVAGGSSSGSGAAVAARLAAGTLGTDTGGSIRLPAACCGIVGLKPTYGRVSRAGAMPLSWTLDHVGPMTATVRDAAVMLGIIAGHDPRDRSASREPVADYEAALAGPVAGLRVGVPENFFFDGIETGVSEAVRSALGVLEDLGARVEPLRVPDPQAMTDACNNAIARSEAATVHARVLADRPHDLGPVVRARAEIGLRVLAVDYLGALRLKRRLTREFLADVFARADLLVTPTTPEPAPGLEAATAGSVEDVVQRMGRFSRLTRPFNTLGLPALSLPCGFSPDGRPYALQIAGRPFDEATVLRLAHAYEGATEWHRRRAPLG